MENQFIDEANEIVKLKTQLEQASAENTELYDFNAMLYVTIDSRYFIQRVNFKASHFFNVDRIHLHHQLFLNYLTEHSKHILEKTIQTLFDVPFKQTCEIELLQKGGAKRQVFLECMLLKNKCIRLSLGQVRKVL
jgi:two-component system sensor kinase FixL